MMHDRVRYVRAPIAARCPELTEADLNAAFGPCAPLTDEAAERLVVVIGELEDRLESMMARLQ